MKGLLRLRHLHLPNLTPYLYASAIQDRLFQAHLHHKATHSSSSSPGPVLLTFQTPPTYTCGRREIGRLSDSQIAHLRAGGRAEFCEALRGGQTTFHGPGQLTAYLILSLQEHRLSPRGYIRLLEDSVIGTCSQFRLKSHTTENPGVWVGNYPDDRKIASVGVHLRRHIASHGIGLNIDVDLSWFERIVACGLVGKHATTMVKELKARKSTTGTDSDTRLSNSELISVSKVANNLAQCMALRLSGPEGFCVEPATEEDLYPEGSQIETKAVSDPSWIP